MKVLALVSLLLTPAALFAQPLSTEIVELSTAPEPAKPAWLERAEQTFEEGLRAESAGDLRTARKRYSAVLKSLAERADDSAIIAWRGEIAGLLGAAEEATLPRSADDLTPDKEVEPVTMEQVKQARPAATVPGAPKSYALHVDPEDPLVKKYIGLYQTTMRGRLQAAFDRMARHREMILKELAEQGLPKELLYLPVIESEYQYFAVSRAGAVGMWQFMPATAKYAGLKINYWVDERRDPDKATRAAVKTLKGLYDWFDDWHLALAAYNRGMYGIQRDLEFTRSTDYKALSKRQGIPLETEQYVPKLMAVVIIGENAEAYGFRITSAGKAARPDEVELVKPLDLKIAAECAGVSEQAIRELNPMLRLWCTPQNQEKFFLKIPAGSKEKFLEKLSLVKDWTPSPGLVKYKIQKGDVLGRVASRYRTTAAAIQRENKIRDPKRLRPGQTILIRPGRGFKGE